MYLDPATRGMRELLLSSSFVDHIDQAGNRVRSVSALGDNTSGVGTGGTTRLFGDSDIGKTITFINNVWSPPDNIPAQGMPEEPVVERAHLGVYTITEVESSSEVDADTGQIRIYEQVITLDREIDMSSLPTALSIAEQNSTTIPLFFQLSADPIPAADNDLKTCIACQIYNHTPLMYKVAALDADYSEDET